MTTRTSKVFIWDAARAAQRVLEFARNRTFEDYLADELFRSAVERQLGIVGEALSGLRRFDPDRAATIPDLARIVALRNILIHGYTSVQHNRVWAIVHQDLPVLRKVLESALAEPEGG